MFIKIEETMEIVIDLARNAILSGSDCRGDPLLEAERDRQIEALKTCEDFYVNHIADGTEDES